MEYTFQYEANYMARYVFDNYEMSTLSPRDSLLTCWKTGKRNEIVTATTEILIEPVLIRIPLNYVTTETKELSIRYSILVKQFTLNLDAYNFWSQLSEYTDYTPWIYFNQPYSVKGNIKSLDDEHEIVLGYFMAAGLDEKRIFVDKPLGVDWNYNTTCGFYTDDLTRRLHLMRNSWPVYLTKYFNGFNVVTALPVEQYCVDCRKSGGVLEPPQFWIE